MTNINSRNMIFTSKTVSCMVKLWFFLFVYQHYYLFFKSQRCPFPWILYWHLTNHPCSVCFQFSDILNGWKILASRGFALGVETASKVRRTKKCIQSWFKEQNKCIHGWLEEQNKCIQGWLEQQNKCIQGWFEEQKKCIQG